MVGWLRGCGEGRGRVGGLLDDGGFRGRGGNR